MALTSNSPAFSWLVKAPHHNQSDYSYTCSLVHTCLCMHPHTCTSAPHPYMHTPVHAPHTPAISWLVKAPHHNQSDYPHMHSPAHAHLHTHPCVHTPMHSPPHVQPCMLTPVHAPCTPTISRLVKAPHHNQSDYPCMCTPAHAALHAYPCTCTPHAHPCTHTPACTPLHTQSCAHTPNLICWGSLPVIWLAECPHHSQSDHFLWKT